MSLGLSLFSFSWSLCLGIHVYVSLSVSISFSPGLSLYAVSIFRFLVCCLNRHLLVSLVCSLHLHYFLSIFLTCFPIPSLLPPNCPPPLVPSTLSFICVCLVLYLSFLSSFPLPCPPSDTLHLFATFKTHCEFQSLSSSFSPCRG